MQKLKKSPGSILLFGGVIGLVLLFNAAMTLVFGWVNLPAAFGTADSMLARIAGAIYALQILDAAALGYFMAYRRAAETRWQRAIFVLDK